MELDYKAIGKRIRIARINNELTQEELAEKVNISPTHLSNIERGVRTSSLDTIVTLVELLDVSIDYIIFGSVMRREAGGLILRSDEELSERYGMED